MQTYKSFNNFIIKSQISILKVFSFVCDFYKKKVLFFVNTRQSSFIWMIDSNHDSTFVKINSLTFFVKIAYFELPQKTDCRFFADIDIFIFTFVFLAVFK